MECRLRGAEPLIDCSGLTVALCDCHFKHTPTVYFYSCEGLLLLSLTLTLILAETLYKFLILEVQTKNFDSGISYAFGSFRQTNVFSCNGKIKDVTARKRKHINLIAFTISLEIYQKMYEVFSVFGQKTTLG